MKRITFIALSLPLLGTSLGAGAVFFLKKEINENINKILLGFASGIMLAASVWSLIIPAIEASSHLGHFAFVPAFVGFWLGSLFLLLLDNIIPHLHPKTETREGLPSNLKRMTMLFFAVTLHNIPEGMAVGAILAGALHGSHVISEKAVLALAIGIAIQNFPEGAVISMPLKAEGKTKMRAFGAGFFSGAVEPVATILTVLASSLIVPALPYFLSFAAGAMFYVVIEELIPEISSGEHSNLGVLSWTFGFTLMMALDVALS
ncbi:MAG: ZIP family metal transporter [Treponemataceae bacterium]